MYVKHHVKYAVADWHRTVIRNGGIFTAYENFLLLENNTFKCTKNTPKKSSNSPILQALKAYTTSKRTIVASGSVGTVYFCSG
jgi:hypothetical protein